MAFTTKLDLFLLRFSQVFFVESVCEDPDVIQENIVVSVLSVYLKEKMDFYPYFAHFPAVSLFSK